MQVSYSMISLIYAKPKYVTVIINCTCHCGRILSNGKDCPAYGRVIVKCRGCKDEGILPLDRGTIKLFHSLHFPHLSGVEHFLDGFEKDMKSKKP